MEEPKEIEYRVFRHTSMGQPYYAVHYVYLNADGTADSWQSQPEELTFFRSGDVEDTIAGILSGLCKPVLDIKTGKECGKPLYSTFSFGLK